MSRKRPAQPSQSIKTVIPQTRNQNNYLRAVIESDVTICDGPAGSGKSYLISGLACEHLFYNKIEKILICRSIVGCDNEIGYLPGGVDEKLFAYIYPYLEYCDFFLGKALCHKMVMEKRIVCYPVELLRGHTYNNTMMILEEGQNCTHKQIKLFLSRIGKDSKAVIVGDKSQADIKKNGFDFCINNLKDVRGVSIVSLGKEDIMRHPVIPDIISIFDRHGV